MPVTTIVNRVNNEQVGRIIQFALDNPRKISFLSFQPVSFIGRDEEITMYRQVVLKEPKPEVATGLQIQGLGSKKKQDEGEPVAH